MRFHEQLKQPTTPAHDRACLEVMKIPADCTAKVFLPEWSWESLELVTLTWFPEEPVREPHRGNLVGFVDLLARLKWTDSEEVEDYDSGRGPGVKSRPRSGWTTGRCADELEFSMSISTPTVRGPQEPENNNREGDLPWMRTTRFLSTASRKALRTCTATKTARSAGKGRSSQ
jgi:hypothetical protein